MPKSDPTSPEAFEDAAAPFERLVEALIVTVLLDIIRKAMKARDGFNVAEWTLSLAELETILRSYERAQDALVDEMVEQAIKANEEWAEPARAEAIRRGMVETLSFGFTPQGAAQTIKEGLPRLRSGSLYLKLVDGGLSPISQVYSDLMRQSARAVADGATYDEAIRGVVQNLRDSGGLRLVDLEANRSYDIYGIVRRHVIDGWRDTCQNYRTALGDSLGMDGVQVSAHMCCAPDHLEYQGRVFPRQEFLLINESLYRPIATGWNCRHMVFPCWADSRSSYTLGELREFARYSNEMVTVNGREMTRYDASQWQRAQERRIRQEKLNAQLFEEAGLTSDANYHRDRARLLTRNYNAESAAVDLRTDPRRLRVGRLSTGESLSR